MIYSIILLFMYLNYYCMVYFIGKKKKQYGIKCQIWVISRCSIFFWYDSSFNNNKNFVRNIRIVDLKGL